jgi:hypothetical protein
VYIYKCVSCVCVGVVVIIYRIIVYMYLLDIFV